ncbi:MAG: RNA methyltransferase [Flavobacteriia bacterium]|nr:RNA methyltransferase [Flavobacteriia bacterium]
MSLIDHWQYISQYLTENRVNRFEEVLSKRTRYAVPVLEDTVKDQNASAVIRTMDALGFHELHLVEQRWNAKINDDISKGSDKWLDIHRHTDIGDSIRDLKSRGYQIVVTAPHEKGIHIRDLPLDKPLAVVFGNEWNGISDEAMELADEFLQIPMYGFVESYNLSVSAAMTFGYIRWELDARNLVPRLPDQEILATMVRWGIHSTRSGYQVYEKWLNDTGNTDVLGIFED